MYNSIYFFDPHNFNLTLGFAYVYISPFDIKLVYLSSVSFNFVLLHASAHRYLLWNRLIGCDGSSGILTAESCGTIISACGRNFLAHRPVARIKDLGRKGLGPGTWQDPRWAIPLQLLSKVAFYFLYKLSIFCFAISLLLQSHHMISLQFMLFWLVWSFCNLNTWFIYCFLFYIFQFDVGVLFSPRHPQLHQTSKTKFQRTLFLVPNIDLALPRKLFLLPSIFPWFYWCGNFLFPRKASLHKRAPRV